MSDLNDLQRRVGEWGEATFPTATNASIIRHLYDELDELDRAFSADGDRAMQVSEEAADCLLILLYVAHRWGFSLIESAEVKMIVNRARTWNTATEAGYVKHDEVMS